MVRNFENQKPLALLFIERFPLKNLFLNNIITSGILKVPAINKDYFLIMIMAFEIL
jgi:hypothetical protein